MLGPQQCVSTRNHQEWKQTLPSLQCLSLMHLSTVLGRAVPRWGWQTWLWRKQTLQGFSMLLGASELVFGVGGHLPCS